MGNTGENIGDIGLAMTLASILKAQSMNEWSSMVSMKSLKCL